MNNPSIVFYIILALYNLVLWEETRRKILSMEKLINLAFKCMKMTNNRISFITMNFLEVIQIYDSSYNDKVKKRKFKVINKDFIKHVESLETNKEVEELYDD